MFARFNRRITEVQMMHVCLGSSVWHWRDIWYVISGKV